MSYSNNAFINAVLGYEERGEYDNIWSRSVCRGLALQNFDDMPYHVPQLLEPSVLLEVARESGLASDAVGEFDYQLNGPVATIKWLLQCLDYATHVQRLSLANCLASTCRYRLARQVLDQVDPRKLIRDQTFAFAMAKFAIDNRLGDTTSHDREFVMMREAIERGAVSALRVLDAASQAIVWHLKTASVGNDLYGWFVEQGLQVAQQTVETGELRTAMALSNFYRAYAMIPAARKEARATRDEMRRAEHFALAAVPKSKLEECVVADARKTVLESTLKEMLYVARDVDGAERAGNDLIALDPHWSISYHELAEVHLKCERYEEALRLYEKARSIGLPRITFSQYMVGACLGQLGRHEEALCAFSETLTLDPSNISAGVSGYRLARSIGHASTRSFGSHIARWDAEGRLSHQYKELVA